MSIIKRITKGAPLTFTELDGNFDFLDTTKADLVDGLIPIDMLPEQSIGSYIRNAGTDESPVIDVNLPAILSSQAFITAVNLLISAGGGTPPVQENVGYPAGFTPDTEIPNGLFDRTPSLLSTGKWSTDTGQGANIVDGYQFTVSNASALMLVTGLQDEDASLSTYDNYQLKSGFSLGLLQGVLSFYSGGTQTDFASGQQPLPNDYVGLEYQAGSDPTGGNSADALFKVCLYRSTDGGTTYIFNKYLTLPNGDTDIKYVKRYWLAWGIGEPNKVLTNPAIKGLVINRVAN